MIEDAKLWFEARPPRERVLIAIMLVLLAITIGVLGIWRPLMSGLDSARDRHEEAVVTLASTRMKADALKRWDKLPGGASAIGVRETVGALATEAGFTVNRGQIVLDKPIKGLGIHTVSVQLHPEVAVKIKLNVARSVEEAQLQASGKSIAELAAEAEAEAEFEIAELFDEMGAAANDE